MKELGVFIDESGDFGEAGDNTAYYLVTFVFHDQKDSIQQQVHKLEESVRKSGFDIEYIHTGPIIRKEGIFEGYSIDERRKLLYKMLNFIHSCPITYLTVAVSRKEAVNRVVLSGKLAKEIVEAIRKNHDFFDKYERIIVYYDNGQAELSSIINAVFTISLSNVEFRKAEPQRYRLLQAADFICTMELLRRKRNEKRLSKSEEKFFYKPQELKKTFLAGLEKLKLN